MSKLNQKVYKFFKTKATSIDAANKTIKFIISDDQPDRMGEIVDQGSWDLKSYQENPIVLWGHDPSEPENVIGQSASVEVSPDGHQTWATLSLDDDINPKAALIWKQLLKGTLRTVSVGFIPHTEEYRDDIPVLKDNELLEISVVPIPANSRAVALAYKAGEVEEKDARWLMDSMRKEADLLEHEIKQPRQEIKNMTEEQATQLLDGIAKLTEKVDAQAAEITALKERVPEPETEEQKTEREAKEAADAQAAKEAEEAKNVAAGLNPDGTAKGGSDDQPGAGDDEFDEDAELTPEQEAEAREALGLPAAA